MNRPQLEAFHKWTRRWHKRLAVWRCKLEIKRLERKLNEEPNPFIKMSIVGVLAGKRAELAVIVSAT